MKPDLLFRLITPKNWTMSAVVGGSAAVAGDLIGFFSNLASPFWLVMLFGAALAIFAVLCIRKALAAQGRPESEVDAVVECRECDGFRFSLFGTGVFLILALIGQGESASERILTRLGVIEDRVTDMHEAMASNMLIDEPESAEAFYHNAYLQLRAHNNPAAAAEAMDTLYADYSPNVMDGAELYWDAHAPNQPAQALLTRMEGLAREKRDANLAVVAARHASDAESRERLMALAREVDPNNPFGHWDSHVASLEMIDLSGGDAQAMAAMYRAQLEGIDRSIALFEARPLSQLYFRPQNAGDPLALARMSRSSVERNAESWGRLAAGGRFFER